MVADESNTAVSTGVQPAVNNRQPKHSGGSGGGRRSGGGGGRGGGRRSGGGRGGGRVGDRSTQNRASCQSGNSGLVPLVKLQVRKPAKSNAPTSSQVTGFTSTLGYGISSRATQDTTDSNDKFTTILVKHVGETARALSSLNDKFDRQEQSKQSGSAEQRLLDAETLKQEKAETNLAKERLRTKEIYNDELEGILKRESLKDVRETAKREQDLKFQRDQIDLKAYEVKVMAEARSKDPEYKVKGDHKRKLEELQADTDNQINLMRATTGCNVRAAIMNNPAAIMNNNREKEEEEQEQVEEDSESWLN